MKTMRLLQHTLTLLALLACLPAHAAGDTLVTGLNTEQVQITARFTGEQVLIFGALSRRGNVVVKVTSPDETVDLSRKVQVGPFWLTGGKVTVKHTPGIFALFSSAPLDKMLSPAALEANGLSFTAALSRAKVDKVPDDLGDWHEALLQLKRSKGYYIADDKGVSLTDGRLFATRVSLPANLPLGRYRLDTYLVSGGKVIAHQQRSFDVSEVKLEGWVSRVAYGHSWLFGVGFTLLAMFGGLGLGVALRRGSDT